MSVDGSKSHNRHVEVSFFVPCYNESENVAGTVDTIQTVMKYRKLPYEILVVDDGSSDETSSRIRTYQEAHPEAPVFAFRNDQNQGLGRNYIRFAQEARGQYYMLIYGDNSMRRADIEAVLSQCGKADMIIPYVANQNERQLHRNLLSRLFNILVGLASGHKLKYYNGPVLHLRENVTRFQSNSSGFAYQAEILCRALTHGCTFVEVPLYYVKSKHTRSSAFRIANMLSVLRSLTRISLRRVTDRFHARDKSNPPVLAGQSVENMRDDYKRVVSDK